jgi:hypothetical protein
MLSLRFQDETFFEKNCADGRQAGRKMNSHSFFLEQQRSGGAGVTGENEGFWLAGLTGESQG